MTAPRGNRLRSILARTFAAILAAVVAAAVSLSPATAQTRERIVDFHSEIWVHADASMTVVETITVDSARRKIKHGIFRDFPTVYRGPTGLRTVVEFELQEVLRGGAHEPFRTEARKNGVRI